MKKTVKILSIISLCAVILCAFALPVFADSSTLSPRESMSPLIPLERIYFDDTTNGISSQVSSPLSLFAVHEGVLNDATCYPTIINTSGTAVTGLITYNFKHAVEGTYNTFPKIVTTSFHNLDEWCKLTSSETTATDYVFERMTLTYHPFLNPYADSANSRNFVTISADYGTNEDYMPLLTCRYTYSYIVDNSEPQFVEAEIALSDASQDGSLVYSLNMADLFPSSNALIYNLRLTIQAIDSSGYASRIHAVEGISLENTFISYTDYINRLDNNMPSGEVRYQQVVNTRTFADLLDFLGDVMEDFLSTELFVVGNLSVNIGTIVATIFGLLFVFMFLRFFSGG